MTFPAPGFRQHFLANQKAELDADAGKADAFAAGLGARRDIVKPRQLAALHARAVVDHGHRAELPDRLRTKSATRRNRARWPSLR